MLGSSDGSFGDELEKEIGMLLREQRRAEADDRERELNIFRSGSAPPTVEGSLSAVGGLFGGGVGGNSVFPDFSGVKNGNGFASEEELRSDPAYHSYYYSNVNLNPRLPPPLLSKEDWRFAQRLKGSGSALGGIGDKRKVSRPENGGTRSLYSMPPGFSSRKQGVEADSEKVLGSADWGGDGLIGLSGLGLGNKKKSLAEIFQDDLGQATPITGHPSRPASRNAFDENIELVASAEAELTHLRNELASADTSRPGANGGSSAGQNIGHPSSYTYAAALGASLSRSSTPDPQLVARAPSPCLTPIGSGRAGAAETRAVGAPHSLHSTSSNNNKPDLVGAFSEMNLSRNGTIDEQIRLAPKMEQDADNHQDYLFGLPSNQNMFLKKSESGHLHVPSGLSPSDPVISNGGGADISAALLADRHVELQKSPAVSRSPYLRASPNSPLNGGGNLASQYQHLDSPNSSFANYGLSGFSLDPALASVMGGQLGMGNLPPLYENAAAASAIGMPGTESRVLGGGLATGSNLTAAASEQNSLNRMANQMSGGAVQAPFMDPLYLQYMRSSEYATQLAALNDPVDRNYLGSSYLNLLEIQKAYLGALLSPQKSLYGVGGKSGGSNHHGYYGNHAFGIGMSYPGSPLANAVIPNSPVGPGSPMRQNDSMRLPSGMRNLAGGVIGPWHLDGGMNENFGSSLLEEFKSNKTKCFELSEIAGHVVEFSADQYGSRFIQQKLETATTDEKNMVYEEIMPHALALMTDVFGNYVIQKFFEHGLVPQRRELANKLFGHVLDLSLQMYGCRVIQKAIEVVDLDQKIKMVGELDGHVMRCVRDQNGNHVVQKCIECVPEDAIHFIVSTFFDQVVNLSTHPYGCRVIQRVLEHCKDPKTQSKVMDEILGSVSMLAQDQYGNYVVQHVLEHGKPHERSAIIKVLTGKIVEMSQQKFASNVVEKCLTFGDPSERQLMVDEMLGTTDENEPLQAMMKDQFANYVVQKVLETCDDQQRELILSRVKVHLNALKKYTYGKHIVARIEKLVAAGERRMAQSPHPA